MRYLNAVNEAPPVHGLYRVAQSRALDEALILRVIHSSHARVACTIGIELVRTTNNGDEHG
jgi:hypothetical protein